MGILSLEETPILQALIRLSQKNRQPLHVPGHHLGRDLPPLFADWLGPAARLDMTELPGLDNLHHATECIAESEQLAATHYGSGRCFFSVNGSSACIMASIYAVVRPGRQKVVLAGPFHWSVWRGVEMAGATPLVFPSRFDRESLLALHPPVDSVRVALAGYTDIAAVVITSPVYAGIVAPVADWVQLAHEFDCPLIVDEAHGPHFGLCSSLPPHSVSHGADLVVQSVHKTLPALGQTAWLHVSGRRVEEEAVEDALLRFTTTSPSYLLLASLDVAQAWLRTEGAVIASRAVATLGLFDEMHGLSHDAERMDGLRRWWPIGNAAAALHLERLLEAEGIFVEYVDPSGALFLFPYSVRVRELERLGAVLDVWRQANDQRDAKLLDALRFVSERHVNLVVGKPAALTHTKRRWCRARQAMGQLAARVVVPYPPGVPILLPGERIEPGHVEALICLAELDRIPVGSRVGQAGLELSILAD